MERLSVLPIRTRVASRLRKALLSAEYAEGQELSLTAIAEELGVSRTPVREAFQELEAEGLITLRMNKGAIVNGIDEKFVRNHFEVRLALECEAVWLASLRCHDFSDLAKLQEQEERHPETIDYHLYNQQFHLGIWQKADNQKMQQLLMSLWNGPSRARKDNTGLHEQCSIEEHRGILDNLLAQKGEAAVGIMRKHIQRSMDNVLQDFQEARPNAGT